MPYVPTDFQTVVKATIDLLWYNVFGTNDAESKLGGNPFDNSARWYSGSSNDLLLNFFVQRAVASPLALAALGPYETSGDLTIPMVTLHTTGDYIIPYGHEVLYGLKAHPTGRGRLISLPVGLSLSVWDTSRW